MSTDFPQLPTDAQLLYEYLGQRIEQGPVNLPAAEVVAELGDYGAQLKKLREMVSEAESSLADGKAKPLDVDALLDRVRNRAATEGRAE
jgi:hypothetical protein